MVKADIKNILKDGLRKTFKNGYSAKNKETALDDLSDGLATEIANYVDQFNNQNGNNDRGLRLLVGELIDEVKTIEVVIGSNIDKEKLNQIKSEL